MRSRMNNSPGKWLRGVVFALVAALAAATLWLSLAEENGRNEIATGNDLRIPMEKVNRGELEIFHYSINASTKVDLAVQKGKDGVIRASFAACRSCKRGAHYLWFGKLICAHCNHLVRLPDPGQQPGQTGGCIPVGLQYVVEGDQFRIAGKTILESYKKWYGEARSGKAGM
jgi:uncharacterized membrane protein